MKEPAIAGLLSCRSYLSKRGGIYAGIHAGIRAGICAGIHICMISAVSILLISTDTMDMIHVDMDMGKHSGIHRSIHAIEDTVVHPGRDQTKFEHCPKPDPVLRWATYEPSGGLDEMGKLYQTCPSIRLSNDEPSIQLKI